METEHEMSNISQVTTGQVLRCRWCDENYNSITKYWIRYCAAMVYWQELLTTRLNEHEAHLDRGTTIAILTERSSLRRDHRTLIERSSS